MPGPRLRPGASRPDLFAQWLKQARKTACFSQQALANAAGTNKGHVSRLEAGRHVPEQDLCVRLARALGQPVAVPLMLAGWLKDDRSSGASEDAGFSSLVRSGHLQAPDGSSAQWRLVFPPDMPRETMAFWAEVIWASYV